MARYIAGRALATLSIIVAASVVIFLVLNLVPGDPARLILGQDATPDGIRLLREELGLDQPLWKQYLSFVSDAVRGDLGISYRGRRDVTAEIASAFRVTLVLTTVAMTLSAVIGVTLGVIAALRANTWIDHILRVTLLTLTSLPIYFLGLILMFVFAVELRLLPAFGWGTPQHLIMPAVTLATFPLALIGRITRASMLDIVSQDFVTTARAKGLSETVIVMRHEMRHILIPLVTIISLQFGILLAGAVLTETIFSIPGMGNLMINAVFARDFPMIRGIVLVAAVAVTSVNFAVDLLYLVIDPRIQYE